MAKPRTPHLKLSEVKHRSDEAKRRNCREFKILEVKNSVDWRIGDTVLEPELRNELRNGRITMVLIENKGPF